MTFRFQHFVATSESATTTDAWASVRKCHPTGYEACVPRPVRIVAFIPSLIVLLVLIVIATKVGWVLVSLGISLVGSLLVGSWLVRRSRRQGYAASRTDGSGVRVWEIRFWLSFAVVVVATGVVFLVWVVVRVI